MEFVSIQNRSNGMVYYDIKDMGIKREFTPKEIKKVSVEEIEKLRFIPGGRKILDDYLYILTNNEEILEEYVPNIQPEYHYTDDDIKEVMINGSLDAFLDLLDFCPEGSLDVIKDLAIKLPLNDVAKREALKDKTGFNVDAALQHLREQELAELEEGKEPVSESRGKRRVPIQTPTTAKTEEVKNSFKIPTYKVNN